MKIFSAKPQRQSAPALTLVAMLSSALIALTALPTLVLAQNVSQPREVNLPASNASNAPQALQFAGRELTSKFTLPGAWVMTTNQVSIAGTTSSFVPQGQSANSFNQRITLQEVPSWVNPARLGREYLNDIISDCPAGNLVPVEKGNVSKFPADILLIECGDAPTSAAAGTAPNAAANAGVVNLAFAVLVQGAKSNLVFSRLLRVPKNNPNTTALVRNELANFKSLIGNLYVCMPNQPALCK